MASFSKWENYGCLLKLSNVFKYMSQMSLFEVTEAILSPTEPSGVCMSLSFQKLVWKSIAYKNEAWKYF